MPGARDFIFLIISMIIYNGAYIGEINAKDFAEALFWYKVEHIGICFQIYCWFIMCVEYAQLKSKWTFIIRHITVVHPILYYLLFFSNDVFHFYTKSIHYEYNGRFHVLVSEKALMYYVIILSGLILAVITLLLYLRMYFTTQRPLRYGYLMMLIGSMFPWLAAYLNYSQFNNLKIDYNAIFTFLILAFYVFGIFRFKFFNTFPIATELVYRQSSDGIILADINNQIIDANNMIINFYPQLKRITKGLTLQSFIQKNPELKDLLDQKRIEYLYYKEDEYYYFRAEVQPIITEGVIVGKIIKITDITEVLEQKKLLQQIALRAINKAETNEMSFLQAQISPHFINNTLSVIASMITRAPEEAKGLITELGEYLASRYYFDSESPMIPLEKELEAVQTYVNIEKARFGKRVKFELIMEGTPEIKIPRLVLQPLVENAIRHGILKNEEGGKVFVIIRRWENKLYFDVRDNGVGISQKYIDNINLLDSEKKGIGLTNINRRLIKYYKEGLSIKRTETGTSVSFWIPLN
jgi:Putative regulator of cell autolysis